MKKGLHPRNRHTGRYDFKLLTQRCPELVPFVRRNPANESTIDFANPQAVKTLNRALLKQYYGIEKWDIPAGFLCPPIPGRADYIHHVADLLSADHGGTIPRGRGVRVLDIGVGANCIYPLIGYSEYGWRFVGSDVDATALAAAQQIVSFNPQLKDAIELRRQAVSSQILKGVIRSEEEFDLTICNPPFHASLAEATQSSRRKWKNLGREPVLNFGGKNSELWCPGGEVAFVIRMIEESVEVSDRVRWFSTLVSKVENLQRVYRALKEARAQDIRTIDMAQGQKKSRVVAWTFMRPGQ